MNELFRQQLLALVKNDIAVRKEFSRSTSLNKQMLKIKMRAIDLCNTQKMKSLIAKHGWQTAVEQGGDMIWRIVQHADHDIKFQKRAYRAFKKYDDKNQELEPWHIAFLKDRILFNSGKPQIYGSQLVKDENGVWQAAPLRRYGEVDKKRDEIGLPPLKVYVDDFNDKFLSRRGDHTEV